MGLILYLLTAGLILLNLVGFGLAALRYFPRFALALPAAVLSCLLVLFFVEHFFGLGAIRWLWPFTTLAAAYSMYLQRDSLKLQLADVAAFVAGFAYCFAWRFVFPDLTSSSEHMVNLFFITNYLPGATLPVNDLWFASQKFDYYYAFQHYAAALLGRLFGLDGGTAYNFAFCVLFGFIFCLAWFAARSFMQGKKRHAALIVFSLVVAGTGISPLYHFLYKNDPFSGTSTTNALWTNTRFIGLYDKQADTKLANILLGEDRANTVVPELPFESIAYLNYIGDFHAPLGGFVLLLLALACMAWLEKNPADKLTQALLALTIPLCIITNTWTFPLQFLLVLAWVIMRMMQGRAPNWKMLFIGAAIGMTLILPFLSYFASQSRSIQLKWVLPEDRAPMIEVFIMVWPLLALAGLGMWQARARKLALLFCLMVFAVLTFTSLMHFDDGITGGIYKRFNTTLKWWPWIQVMAIAGIASINLSAGAAFVRYATVAVLLLVSTYSLELLRYWIFMPKASAGKMAGHHWFTQDTNQRDLLGYLRAAPNGTVLENITGGGYSKSGALSLFAAKPSLLTWPDHMSGWKGNMTHMRLLQTQITQFYAGQKEDIPGWLQANKIRYIVWLPEFSAQAFDQIKPQIEAHYHWKPFDMNPSVRLGVWVLK